MFSGHCVKHNSIQNFKNPTWCQILVPDLSARAPKLNLYVTINLEWQIE